MALRIAYTQYRRHQSAKESLPIASNAIVTNTTYDMPESYMLTAASDIVKHVSNLSSETLVPAYSYGEKEPYSTTAAQISASDSDSDTDQPLHRATPLSNPIALLPQYLAPTTTTLTITEHPLPHLSSNFTVTTTNPTLPTLNIHRNRPSLSHHLLITDSDSSTPLLQIRRLRAQLPISYTLSDPTDTRIAELQGNFSTALTGKKSTMVFTNACTGEPSKVSMHGSWRNRSAVIRDESSGEVLASMSSEIFNLKALVGGRRTYEVLVREGVDVVMIAALVVGLDERTG